MCVEFLPLIGFYTKPARGTRVENAFFHIVFGNFGILLYNMIGLGLRVKRSPIKVFVTLLSGDV
jgi:hypothetical protein